MRCLRELHSTCRSYKYYGWPHNGHLFVGTGQHSRVNAPLLSFIPSETECIEHSYCNNGTTKPFEERKGAKRIRSLLPVYDHNVSVYTYIYSKCRLLSCFWLSASVEQHGMMFPIYPMGISLLKNRHRGHRQRYDDRRMLKLISIAQVIFTILKIGLLSGFTGIWLLYDDF